MSINFPDSPTNGQVALIGGKNYTYNSTKNTWTPTQVTEADLSTVGSTTVVATHDLLPASPSAGDMALVSSVNKMYVYFLSGWWLMSSLQNASPSGITGNAAIYDLAADGTPTTVTLSSSDPEGFPIVWSHSVISGSLGGTTVTNVNNVFTITPSTDAADAGTFTLRFAAADGQGGESGSQSNFTLDFVFIVTNSNYTTLLATATGTSDNNNITDSSTNSHAITVNGDALAGTFSPYRSGGYSTYFDGNDYLTATHTNPLGTADFTVEGWINFDNVGGNRTLMTLDSHTQLYFRNNGSSIAIYPSAYNFSTGTPEVNTWYHFAFVRQSGSVTLYWNGQSKGSTSHAHDYTSGNLHIGCWSAISEFFQGHLTDIKISNTAVYTSNFSVPTERLSSDSSTQLITCHLPYIADGSNLAETIVVNGDPSTKPFSPYDYNEYDAANNGGSLTFNGTNSAVEIADNDAFDFGTGDLTIECWVYPEATSNSYPSFLGTSAGWGSIAASGFRFDNLGDSKFQMVWSPVKFLETQSTYKHNQWYHFVVTRTGGSTWRMFVNGILESTGTNSASYDISIGGNTLQVGGKTWDGGNGWFKGHVSDLRLTKGSVVTEYQTTSTTTGTKIFTPRTSPISSSGSELHLKCTDASIIDKSQGGNLTLIGDTTGSTTQAKFSNTKSMYFDGTGDRATITGVPDLGDDFTIECWLYSTTTGNRAIVSSIDNVGSWGSNGYWSFGCYGGNYPQLQIDGGSYSGANSTLPTNQWVHLAVTRTSNTVRYFINGSVNPTTFSNSLTLKNPSGIVIGSSPNNNYIYNYTGYIQDLRISNECKYTANFTPPTEPLGG